MQMWVEVERRTGLLNERDRANFGSVGPGEACSPYQEGRNHTLEQRKNLGEYVGFC